MDAVSPCDLWGLGDAVLMNTSGAILEAHQRRYPLCAAMRFWNGTLLTGVLALALALNSERHDVGLRIWCLWRVGGLDWVPLA